MKNTSFNRKLRRKLRVSRNITGTELIPRIVVYRSNKYIYAQAINDEKRATVAAFSSLVMKKNKDYKKTAKTNEARQVGLGLAGLLKKKKVEQGVYDRSFYNYKGRVRALAEGLREGGVKI